jgi:hypothetical protein
MCDILEQYMSEVGGSETNRELGFVFVRARVRAVWL